MHETGISHSGGESTSMKGAHTLRSKGTNLLRLTTAMDGTSAHQSLAYRAAQKTGK